MPSDRTDPFDRHETPMTISYNPNFSFPFSFFNSHFLSLSIHIQYSPPDMSDQNQFLSDSTDDATSSHRRYHPYRRQPPITCRHTHFYFPSGNFFMRIQGWLFRLHSEVILTPPSHIRSHFLDRKSVV